jgi:hypothetical protein
MPGHECGGGSQCDRGRPDSSMHAALLTKPLAQPSSTQHPCPWAAFGAAFLFGAVHKSHVGGCPVRAAVLSANPIASARHRTNTFHAVATLTAKERAHIYPGLAAALAKRGFAPATIEKHGQLWDSITDTDRLPCPFCYT